MSEESWNTDEMINLREDRELVRSVGAIYLHREDQTITDPNFERLATLARQYDDEYSQMRRSILLATEENQSRTPEICAAVALRFRPKNLKLVLYIDDSNASALEHNYGDSQIFVSYFADAPLMLDNMDVRQYFNYTFEVATTPMPMSQVYNLLRRCRGRVTLVNKSPSFDNPPETIVPHLKTLLEFLWQEALSSDRGKFDLTFFILLNDEQKRQLRQHCIDISPEGTTTNYPQKIRARLPVPDESTILDIYMVIEHAEYDYSTFRVYTNRSTLEGLSIPLEARWL